MEGGGGEILTWLHVTAIIKISAMKFKKLKKEKHELERGPTTP